MPAVGTGKRKRGDRSWSGDSGHDGQRPSPHRPNSLNLANQGQGQNQGYGRDGPDSRGRGGRRVSRGGRPGNNQIRSPNNGPTPMSPPPPSKTPVPSALEGREITSTPPPIVRPENPQTQPPAVEEPQKDPAPFEYEFLPDEVISSWEESGRTTVLDRAKEGIQQRNALLVSSIIQELVRSALDGRLDPQLAGGAIKELCSPSDVSGDVAMVTETDSAPVLDVQTLFLDTLSILTEAEASGHAAQSLVSATGISPDAMREELDATLLQSLGLIRDTFARMGIRKQTNLLYRQANFNLLREESEGFAKLMTELFTTSEKAPTSEVVDETVERVKAMIGAFDLDVGKTLDVVLDIFGTVLVKHYRFFVRFLRRSPWWPREVESKSDGSLPEHGGLPDWAHPDSSRWSTSEEHKAESVKRIEERDRKFWNRARESGLAAFFEIGRQPASESHLKNSVPAWNGASLEDEADVRKWIEETGILLPKGNRDAAQLLGFKLRFYSSSAARSKHDTLPDHLIHLAALLIKIGFISLRDLYPHVWRPDDQMESLRQEKVKEKTERELAARPGAGAKNALLMAGALADDTLPIPSRLREQDTRSGIPSKEAEVEKGHKANADEDSLPEPADQKVLLVKSLLAIGALPEALYILGRFPWLLDLYPEMPEYIHRIIHYSLSKVYDPLRPLGDRPTLRDQQRITDEQAGIPKGQIRLIDAPQRKTLRWFLLDKEDSTSEGLDYRFYWDDWADNIPVCQTVEDVFTLCDTFVNLSGVKIGQDSSLLVKLARIGKDSVAKDSSESNKARWIQLCKRLLVPALSFTKANPGVINEVYDLISSFSRETRYSMYAEWFSGRTSRNPDIKAAFDLARAETKDVLKRLSKTNARPTARTLGKIAYGNPHVVMNIALGQIEAYDNFAEVVTEGARYFTFLGYDVLSWSLISSLGRMGRSRVQEGGLLTSRWLSALALFAGKVYKRYSTLNTSPILQYVANQLRKGNSTDLIVLEQMILSMAGIVTDTGYNESQLQAMGGWPLLQSQTILQLLDKRHDPALKLSARRVMRGLRDSGLVGQMLLLIAQQRRMCVYNVEDTDAPLKLLGNLFDEIHRILVQYLDLLKSNLTLEEFMDYVPNVSDMISQYGIEPEVAFWISRPTIAHQMMEFDKTNPDAFEKKKPDLAVKESTDMDVEMKDDSTPNDDPGAEFFIPGADAGKQVPETSEVVQSEGTMDVKEDSSSPVPVGNAARIWHPILESIMEAIKPGLPRDVLDIIGLPFYTTFWQLSLYDVNIPGKAYEDEIGRQKKQIVSNNSDRTDLRRRDERKKHLNELVDNLLAENRQHLKSFSETKARLLREKDHWFEEMFQKHEALNLALMERCFLPRISLSPLDAFFCFKFIKFLHANGTLNFRTLGLYDLIFREARLTSLIFSCSSKEADNFGRFLNEVFRDLGRWHKDRAVYEREAYGARKQLPGFAKKVASTGKPETFLDFEDFRKILYKWHTVMYKALRNCLSSTDYMHIRNAISVLKAISQHFPAINWIGSSLQTTVSDLGKSDKEDVRVPSAALMGDLNRREKEWMIPQAFRQGDDPNSASAKANTPQPGGKTLNAEAAEFKPGVESKVNGEATTTPAGGAEDGEVDDTEMTDIKAKQEQPSDILSEVKVEAATTVTEEESAALARVAEKQAADEAAKLKAKLETPQPISRPTTPAAKDSDQRTGTVPSRLDTIPNRPESTKPLPANLPSRPERPESRGIRPSDARIPSRPPDPVQEKRDQRTHSEYGRSDRSERPDERSRDRPPHLTNGARPYDRQDHERYDTRDPSHRQYPPDRHHQGPLRESRSRDEHSGRSPRHDSAADRHTRRSDVRQVDNMPPPQVAPSQAAHSVGLNPERAALINEGVSGQPDSNMKAANDDRRSRGSRPSSPRRDDDRTSRRSDRRDHPGTDRYTSQRDQDHRQRGDEGRLSREDFPPSGPSQQSAAEVSRGRLNEDSRHPARRRDEDTEPTSSSKDIASGPRARDSGQPNREAPVGAPQGPGRPAQERFPPSGPGRGPSRNPSFQDQGQASSAAQSSGDATGIHPDRLKAFQSSSSEQPSSRQDRFEGRPAPPPLQTSPLSAPSGPRNAPPNAPSGPSPVSRGPPTGPQYNDSGRGRGQRNALSAVNNTLQQAGQGTSIRGRGGARNSNMSHPPPQSGPPTPTAGSRSETFQPQSQDSEPSNSGAGNRPDLFDTTSRSRDSTYASQRSDPRDEPLHRPPPRQADLIDEEHASARRPTRHSSSGRNGSPERESGRPRRDRDGGYREGEREREKDSTRDQRDRDRDTRSDRGRVSERESRPSGESHRERDRSDRDSRDPASRRDDRNHLSSTTPQNPNQMPVPPRRSNRRDDPPSQSRGPPPPPPSFSDSNDSRRGYPPNDHRPPPSRSNSDRNYDPRDHNDRGDRDRDRPSSSRGGGSGSGGPPPSGPRDRDSSNHNPTASQPPSGPSNSGVNSITPQKRARPTTDSDGPLPPPPPPSSSNEPPRGGGGYGRGPPTRGSGPGSRYNSISSRGGNGDLQHDPNSNNKRPRRGGGAT